MQTRLTKTNTLSCTVCADLGAAIGSSLYVAIGFTAAIEWVLLSQMAAVRRACAPTQGDLCKRKSTSVETYPLACHPGIFPLRTYNSFAFKNALSVASRKTRVTRCG